MNKYICLLLKQHNITKKYYLCKRVTSNIKTLFTYTGSGKRWLKHIHKHGNNISTCVLLITRDITKFKEIATFYNTVWKVGENANFLNLRPEEGDGGDTWKYSQNTLERKNKISLSLKKFNITEKGKEIRARVGNITSNLQKNKTMKERLGENYYDTREGKKWHEIYKKAYSHPQQKSFKIICNNKEWIFNNEREFKEVLGIHPDPVLRTLKKQGMFIIKHVKKNSKHFFEKNSQLFFEWL